ncbi:MAG TPA: argininosuccinate lyase [Candidatus Binataceae bacterium]|nr:argininosuccinate lyase [Candidatus Binataceae bacterium]
MKASRSGAPEATNLLRGRFKKGRLPEVESFTASLPFDRRLYRHDIRGSIAHARMLGAIKLLSPREVSAITAGLRAIEREIDQGAFNFVLSDEDIHLAIERRLTEKIGAPGQKLHTGRSRNDQVALDLRLYLRDEIAEVLRLIECLRQSLIAVAAAHAETVMPGYTHLQRAQPVTLAHHLIAYVEMFGRDYERFEQTLHRTDVMPLGAGALAGSTLPLDRHLVARELGFSRIAENSMDAVADRDFVLDFLSASAILAIHFSRMAEEIILWTTAEFGFADLPDEFATGSSMMPQKKNPDLLELIRGKTGRVVGALMAMLTILKGLPLTYNSDLQEDKERVFDVVDTIKPVLSLLSQFWPQLAFKPDVMRAGAGGFALATDLAEYLVSRGVPFREAHEIVGSLVRDTIARGLAITDLTLEDLRRYSPKFGTDALAALSVDRSLEARALPGGPAPKLVRTRLRRLRKERGPKR